jgi:hypothetical protein
VKAAFPLGGEATMQNGSDQHPSKPPLSIKTSDEGNIPGRPSPAVLAIIVLVLLVAGGAMYLAG